MRDRLEKLIAVAALTIALELVLFKFLPDIGTAVIQGTHSTLSDFGTFQRKYLIPGPGNVHHARFLGNYSLYALAEAIGHFVKSADPRLHPLRVAAGIWVPFWAFIGALPALRRQERLSWREFLVPYGLAVLIGQYVFYPADMPGLAFLSLGLWLLLRGSPGAALLLMLVTGLFRESAFHLVWLAAAWALCDRSAPSLRRLTWPIAFGLTFALEYVLIRHFFPSPVSAAGAIVLDPAVLFLDRGLLSLTTICSLSLAVLFPLACLLKVRDLPADDWHRRFFLLNCWVFPGWVIFYRMMSGNLSEFRMLLPALIPCIYGLAWRHSHASGACSAQTTRVAVPESVSEPAPAAQELP